MNVNERPIARAPAVDAIFRAAFLAFPNQFIDVSILIDAF